MDRPLALVTGASSGIGRAIALQLAREKRHDLLLVARRGEELARLAAEVRLLDVKAHVLAQDLALPEAAAKVQAFADALGFMEILVNNAGFGLCAPSWEQPDKQLQMIDLNVRTLTELCVRFLPAMVGKRRGRILNIASVGAFQPVPFMAVYSATKAYVVSYTAALNLELDGTGVTATASCPGPVSTGFGEVAGVHAGSMGATYQEAQEVAEAALSAMRAGKAVATTGPLPALAQVLVKLSPRMASAWVSGRLMKLSMKRPA